MPAHPAWRPILYEQQPFPDNYVDHSFLASVLSTPVERLDVLSLTKDSAIVTQQVSTVGLFCTLYYLVYNGQLSAMRLIVLDTGLLLMGWSLHHKAQQWPPNAATLRSDARKLVLLVGWLLSLSPVLATLTQTWSDDTICALVLLLFSTHIALYDYAYASNHSERFEGTLSMNAAVFASVLLAARLPSIPHVFAIMALSMQAFVLLPAQWRLITQSLSSPQHLCVSTLLVLLTATVLLIVLKPLLAISYLLAIFTISVLCPWLLVHLQQSKRDISGPWDAAVRSFLLAATSDGATPSSTG